MPSSSSSLLKTSPHPPPLHHPRPDSAPSPQGSAASRGTSENSGNMDDRRILLAITVEIEEGRMELIAVREGDCAEDVATRFCKEHSIPDRYVFPLTEHIVSKLQDISGSDVTTTDDHQSNRTTGKGTKKCLETNNGEDITSSSNTQQQSPTRSLHENTKPKLCTHKLCSLKTILDQEIPKIKTRKPSGHHVLPSFASLAKCQKEDSLSERKLDSQRSPQLSPKSNAVYTRLYVEFLHQKQRMEEEKKICLEQYKERLERDKPAYTKKTRKLMLMRGRVAKQFKNYGELLYYEALHKDAERRRIAEQKHQEEQSHELREITAKPVISKYAKQLKRPDKFWERLSTDNSKHHLRELQHESLEMKLMECTFRPRINRKFVEEQDTVNASRFDQLFWDAENRRRRQAEYMQWYPEGVTFRPMINPHWNPSNIYNDGSQKGDVFNRLLQYASKLAEKKQKWQEIETKLVDPTTGQELFHPQTGRKPHGERKTDAMPIGDFLFHLKSSLDRKKETLVQRKLEKAKELANCHYVGSKSSKLLERRRLRSIQQIFHILDTDNDGIIDLTRVDLANLSSDIVEDLNEARKIGAAFERRLSIDKFTRLMMSVQKKKRGAHLLIPCKKHAESEKHPFKFKVDHHSCRLASGRRKPGNSRHWYRLVLSDKKRNQAKIEALRKEKEDQELAECTFKPSLHSKGCKGSARFIHGAPPSNRHSPHSTASEKEQEIHGFIFQEVNMGEPAHAHSASASDASPPLSFLKSLKRIVLRSNEGQDDKSLQCQNC